jgi:hypothetical protein
LLMFLACKQPPTSVIVAGSGDMNSRL